MKILITVDPEIPVPPTNYGGIERIVSGLASEYSKLGHEVYLIANSESTEKNVVKIFGWNGKTSRGKADIIKNSFQLLKITRIVKPDVIHSFSRLLYLYPNLFFNKIKFLQTYQRKISNKSTGLFNFFAGNKIKYTSCSNYMFKDLPNNHKWHGIYNFTDTDYFVPDANVSKEYLMFLGRIEDIKGTKECIEVAIATNTKLIIAGNIQPGHDKYFDTYIKPHLDNPLIEYVGSVNDEQKKYYLQKSKAFLFPIKWEEPFGIVMAEAMACGTPVIGFNRGSVPEVIKDGETGFVVNNISEMTEAVNKINMINRDEVRKDCVERFSLEVITKQYLKILEKLKYKQ